jgi:hypothetical protein
MIETGENTLKMRKGLHMTDNVEPDQNYLVSLGPILQGV